MTQPDPFDHFRERLRMLADSLAEQLGKDIQLILHIEHQLNGPPEVLTLPGIVHPRLNLDGEDE